MFNNTSTQSSSDQVILLSIAAAFSTFVVGYTAARVYLLDQPAESVQVDSEVIPHEGELWKGLSSDVQ